MTQPYGFATAETAPRSLEELVEGFGVEPMRCRGEIESMRQRDPEAFAGAALPLILNGRVSPGHLHLLSRLLATGAFIRIVGSAPEGVIRAALRIDPWFDIGLTRWLLEPDNRKLVEQLGTRAEQLLDALAESSPGNRLLPLIVQFLRSNGERVSSKAALFVARRSGQVDLALSDVDGRVRANAIEALWGIDTLKARHTLWSALDDGHNRVVGNALLGLLGLGDRSLLPRLRAMAEHREPLFRATAAWVMGQSKDKSFYPVLLNLKAGGPETVTAAAVKSLEGYEGDLAAPGEPAGIALQLLGVSGGPGDRKTVRRHARLPAGATGALTVRVRLNGRDLAAVQVRRRTPGPLALGILAPAAGPDEARLAVRSLLEARRPADRFAVARYSPKMPAEGKPAGNYEPLRGLTLNDSAAGIPRVVFSAEPHLPAQNEQEEESPCLFDALRSLLAPPPGLATHAGVVLFAAPGESLDGELREESVAELIHEAKAHDVSIHGAMLPGLSAQGVAVLRTLCAETRGILVPASSAENLYECFADPLEVTFRGRIEPGDRVVLTVESGDAAGEVELGAGVSAGRTG